MILQVIVLLIGRHHRLITPAAAAAAGADTHFVFVVVVTVQRISSLIKRLSRPQPVGGSESLALVLIR